MLLERSQWWNVVFAIGLGCFRVGIWLGLCISSRQRLLSTLDSVAGSRRIDVRAVRDARQVLLRFRQSSPLYHHRVLLNGDIDDLAYHYVLTPGRRVRRQRFDGATFTDILMYDGALGSIAASECYRDVDSKYGIFLPEEIDMAVRVARGRIAARRAVGEGRVPPRILVDQLILEVRPDRKGVGGLLPGPRVPPVGPPFPAAEDDGPAPSNTGATGPVPLAGAGDGTPLGKNS